jgi:transposase
MARPIGPRKIYRYPEEFRAMAVRLTEMPNVHVQDVARSLDVHPFVLSRWRREAREGRLVTKRTKRNTNAASSEGEELRRLRRDYARLKAEHERLKKTIRSNAARKNVVARKRAGTKAAKAARRRTTAR